MFKTLVVIEDGVDFPSLSSVEVISFERYLTDYPKQNEPKTRVINLCDAGLYLSKGYYCSLLAEARGHKVLPSVRCINEVRAENQDYSVPDKLLSPLNLDEAKAHELTLFLGKSSDAQYSKVAAHVYSRFAAPLLKVTLFRRDHGWAYKVQQLSVNELSETELAMCVDMTRDFTTRVWRSPSSKRRYRWDMAILVNPEEKTPPSDAGAIKRFIKAADKFGIFAETVTADSIGQISRYDALFIRETTAIDHHTYALARKAEDAGLVVIDDSDSILRCCNKVFLHDAFSYQGVPSPKTRIVTDAQPETLDSIEKEFSYPIVLKIPEGSFSLGVYKVQNRSELQQRLQQLFESSALALVQEYLYTEFDWRVGVLNSRAIYACRYHMARNHWQIYNHSSKRFNSGGFETLPTFELPRKVMDAAVKAAGVIGSGLYGVDLKQVDNQVYVIEVNDNPSLDHKVEDAYLGDELYMLIMAEFGRRLELRGR